VFEVLFAGDEDSESESTDYPYLDDESSLKSSTKLLKFNLSDTITSNHMQLPDESKINTEEAAPPPPTSNDTKNNSITC